MKKTILFLGLMILMTTLVFADEQLPLGVNLDDISEDNGLAGSGYNGAQSFQYNEEIVVTGAIVYVSYYEGYENLWDNGLFVRLKDNLTGTVLATSDIAVLTESDYTTHYPAWVELNFSSPYTINASTYYFMDFSMETSALGFYAGAVDTTTGVDGIYYLEGSEQTGKDLVMNVTYETPCIPNWQCSEYTDCIIRPYNHKDCESVTDLNSCGESYTGDYSEFETSCTVESDADGSLVGMQRQAPVKELNLVEQFILRLRAAILSLFGHEV